ncbi:MAG: ABC transporter permease [Hyphomicrobiaceae bacterium]|nr:ABC transporter permease [Hyphomicrobiaceae bacterium]
MNQHAPVRKSRLDRSFDRIRALEEAGALSSRVHNRSLRKFLSNPLASAGVIMFLIILLTAIFAPLIVPYDPLKIDLRALLQPPSAEHWLGTDKVGRDVFARILYGGRISIFIGLGSAVAAGVLGVAIGCISAYKRGWLDAVVLRVSEVFIAFPQIILVLLLVSILGQSLINLLLIFIATGWAPMYRMVRARVLSLREEEYVQALEAFGISTPVIAYKHILPNALGPVTVQITLSTAAFILAEAGLSFLGLGVPLQIPTWGNILNAANDMRILEQNWWIWLPVGLVISAFVLAVNFIGDGLRDSSDPTQQG